MVLSRDRMHNPRYRSGYHELKLPVKFAIPMKTLARLDGTPALLKTVEEK